MTRVKICGITSAKDGRIAADAGADAVGLVFHPSSPRYVSPQLAAEIVAALPPFVTTVGLFVNHEVDQVGAICDQVQLDLLQFHGDESPQWCEQFGRRFIKAIRMEPDQPVAQMADQYHQADAILLDAFDTEKWGGSGNSFDWRRVPVLPDMPVILAGGLTCGNVAAAVEMARPYAVDVSSGVESAPGIKSASQIIEFITRVKNCE